MPITYKALPTDVVLRLRNGGTDAHGRVAERHPDTPDTPAMSLDRDCMLVKGYDDNNRIKYSTCSTVAAHSLTGKCEEILAEPDVTYIHIRSATANCYQCRVERA